MENHKLFRGSESEAKIRKLAEMARLTSKPLINALVEHYTVGRAQTGCGYLFGISQQAVGTGANKLTKQLRLAHAVVLMK